MYVHTVGRQKSWDWFLKHPHSPTPNQPNILARLEFWRDLNNLPLDHLDRIVAIPSFHLFHHHPHVLNGLTLIKKTNLPDDTKARIVGMYEAGASGNVIAVKLKIRQTTIYNVLQRYRQRGSIQTAKRPGRPRKLTDRDLRELGRIIKHLRKMKAPEICNLMLKEVSTRTIRQKAHEMVFFFQGWLPRSHLLMKIKEKDGLPLPVIINIGQSTIGRRLSGPMSPALKLVNNTSKWWSGERLERKSNPAAWSPHSRVGGPLSWCGVHSLAREPPLLLSCRQSDAPPKILLKLCMRALGPWIQSFDRSNFFFLIKDGAPVHKAKISEDWRHSNDIKKTRLASPVPRPQSDRESLEKF